MTPNPALDDIAFLAGTWDVELSNASFLPDPADTVRGRVDVEWIADGALLALFQDREPGTPAAATWVFGRDDSSGQYQVFYADSRKVSRIYTMSFAGSIWRMWRDDPTFSQRFEAIVNDDRTAIAARWERRSNGGGWEHDFDLTYTKHA